MNWQSAKRLSSRYYWVAVCRGRTGPVRHFLVPLGSGSELSNIPILSFQVFYGLGMIFWTREDLYSKVLILIVPSFIFNCIPPDSPNVPLNFLSTLHRHLFQYASKKQAVPLPLNHPRSLTPSLFPSLPPLPLPLPPIFCLSHHQTKISVMKTSAGQLVRGLEMEIEKLKGSERSVCARITAHFITGRNGQIWIR